MLAPVHDESSEEAHLRLSAMRWQVSNEAVAAAAARWDGWFAQACAAVDRLLAVRSSPSDGVARAGTVSSVSTSPNNEPGATL
jgi:hypothetical protein